MRVLNLFLLISFVGYVCSVEIKDISFMTSPMRPFEGNRLQISGVWNNDHEVRHASVHMQILSMKGGILSDIDFDFFGDSSTLQNRQIEIDEEFETSYYFEPHISFDDENEVMVKVSINEDIMQPTQSTLLAQKTLKVGIVPYGVHMSHVAQHDQLNVLNDEIINEVNSMDTTWKAGINKRFDGYTYAEVKALLGTWLRGHPSFEEPDSVCPMKHFDSQDDELPENFDSRDNWSQCASVIGHVRDQSDCGSCWAFGSTEAFNDRYCIKTGDLELLSPEDTLACCNGYKCLNSNGCNGGQPSGAWRWFIHYGVSTGGDYSDIGTGTTCKPYEFPNCAHHVETDEYPDCPSSLYKTPTCTSECSEDTYPISYENDKHFASTHYTVKGEENIMREIYNYGTVTASIIIYDDFLTYTGGVYQHEIGDYDGGHSVKMIGWGVEDDGTKYWKCVNSWNDTWGDVEDPGTFKILRGSDECGIESSIVAGQL